LYVRQTINRLYYTRTEINNDYYTKMIFVNSILQKEK